MNNIFGLLFMVLLILKLTGLVNIGWLAVFSPLIIGFVLFFVFLFIAAWASTKTGRY